jgi:hypothetical protein
MAKEKDLIDPEIDWEEDSEISATVDLFCIGADGVPRPILICHDTEVFIAISVEDAEKLQEFLTYAIRFCKTHDKQKGRLI